MRRRELLGASLALCLPVGGCECNQAGSAGGKPVVVASIFPIYDLVRRVAGEAAQVELLLPPGQSEHDYNPSTKLAKTVSRAKVAFLVGLSLDDWGAKTVEAGGGGARLVRLATAAQAKSFQTDHVGGHAHERHEHEAAHEHGHGDHGHGDHGHDDHGHDDHGHGHDHEKSDHDKHGDHGPDDHGHDDHDHEKREAVGEKRHGAHAHDHPEGLDPHVWLSVPNAIAWVDAIAKELATAIPPEASAFSANAAAVTTALQALDREIRESCTKLRNKRLVTFHGSFGYFAAEYGLDIVAVIEPFPGKQPSAAYLKEVLGVIRERKPAALFSEPQLDRRPAEVLAAEAGLPLSELDPIGGTSGRESYEALLRFNLAALREAMK
jgi:ABC-type Zn uptake system ZnuABC Zn-binding protein ZnuA